MNTGFSYTTTYFLDKPHFSETYDESVKLERGLKAYGTAVGLALAGVAVLLFTPFTAFLAWFLIGLGVVEGLSVRFKKPWWLARQMLSRAANHEVTLTLDEQGIHIKSTYVNSSVDWENISHIEPTSRGWLFYQGKARSYLSNGCLSDEALAFIRSKAAAKSA
ncbi:YcxB family protein [Lacimicrobium sp. SS2-24]|uniref:YcxB family protein n=1 Tax=Lacimicrobium sp. SS2-24 TaxID=2005569 RepID=UPI000B4B9996|nr:YcxB family protein [Lacimicrobium sp. SS2-24]